MTQPRLTALAQLLRRAFSATAGVAARAANASTAAIPAIAAKSLPLRRGLFTITALGLLAWGGWKLAQHPPFVAVEPGTIAVRANTWTGSATIFAAGSVLALPGVHHVRSLSLRDQLYRPQQGRSASGEGAFQSVEGLSLGVDLTVRWAIDPEQIEQAARSLPPQIDRDVVEPAVQGVVYRVFSAYSVREIFSSKRREIQQAIEADLIARLRTDGLVVKGVQFGKVDLPADYRAGMERLLAEELETDKMRYTLELKEKRVKQTELEAQAEKVRRETAAAAAAAEQIIAAKAQEEAMRHVLPLEQKQIEQRKLGNLCTTYRG